ADKMNQHNKIVFSKTIKQSLWHPTNFVSGDPTEEIMLLKGKKGKDMILFGSASIASALIRSGMVDEYHLWIHPVILGRGKPIFHDLRNQIKLKLKDSVIFESGAVANYYSLQ
ncbi:MAG TPA: dihydrofolate reductase family protein, partial [Puia sp.]